MASRQAIRLFLVVLIAFSSHSLVVESTPASALSVPPGVRNLARGVVREMPQERVAIAVTGERLLQLKTLVPENTNTWTHAWANSAFRAKAFGFADTMSQRARTRITKWIDFQGNQTAEDLATKRVNKMLCHVLLESFWKPGEQFVRYDWVRAMLEEISLPMSDESTADIAEWMTRRINGRDLRVSLACAGWVRLAGG